MAAANAQQAAKVMGEELETAAFNGETDEILRLWRENGERLDVEYKDGGGRTPLHWAARNGHGEACRALISTCRANVDSRRSDGWTPLMCAAAYSNLQCVEVLLELGANITARDNNCKTALFLAQMRDHAEIASFLTEAGRSPMVKSALKV
jgi:ankyrin repeat protein